MQAGPATTTLVTEGMPRLHATANCRAGDSWSWDGVTFRFLHPPRYFPYLDNESSCVLKVEAEHGSALITGDVGEVVERDLVRRERALLESDVVVIAHHGSKGASGPGCVEAPGARLARGPGGPGTDRKSVG